ncbi:hypothetical protein BASA81_013848 [Batrachochytrium salamandrivorans]|nr:hypothetical protein BASA81_013848 [Batrachochytrium salamandrivorans]
MLQSLKNSVLSNAHAVAEAVMPVLQESRFAETGVLTPGEFVLAGDNLVAKCPSWSWSAGDADRSRAHLPRGKQFLVTRGVPCRLRANAALVGEGAEEDAEGWVQTGAGGAGGEYADLEGGAEEDEYVDLEGYEEEGGVADAAAFAGGLVLRTRTYDLSITYDKYYQTPRMFLQGFDERGVPLTPEQIFQDISQDYANKTATIEAHPHLGTVPQCVSIHPCKHAQIMKKFIDKLSGGNGADAKVDQAMFVFLKFMQGLVPTVDYDFTVEVNF